MSENQSWISWLPGRQEFASSHTLLHGLAPNILYSCVGVDYLNGLINHVVPLRLYLLERYRKLDLDNVAKVVAESNHTHKNLTDFDDDVIVLAREERYPQCYWLFWFDCDVSDCCIGWCTHEDEAWVCRELERWLDAIAAKGQISDWIRLPAEYRGTLRF